ncbi:MAG: polyamine ABC transporter substrate-binding protein [Hyphomicrobiales bacterium]|nr:polyamine ABC transporter substrate-binding protein [Hyphomicrobiales bacterium]OQW84003.1 MAG: spermidine/putrescine ABC transporter substrate-binding protein PotF [Proteobacteria bacterium ST_bin15]
MLKSGTMVILGVLLSLLIPARSEELRIYNWSDYVNPLVITAFEQETGVKVIYDTFDQMDIVESKLLAGKTGYDLVVVTASFLPRQIPLNLYLPLDKSQLANLANAWDEVTSRLGRYDPGNRFAVNYMWGTTGIGYNVAKVRQRLGADAPLDSWELVFDPAILRKLRDCGVYMLDATEELFPAALRYLSLDPDSKSEADLRRAAELLQAVRPFVKKYHSSEYINALAGGDICLAIGYSGDVLQARKRAREAAEQTGKPLVDIAYVIPREGALMWFDNFVIPRDAANPQAAHRFIDFVNRPQNAALNSNFIQYANSNLASQKFIDKSVLDDAGIFPPPVTFARLYTITPYDEATQRLVNRLFTRIKSNR